MRGFCRTSLILAALAAAPIGAQVQLFENDVSGVYAPILGVQWNKGITEGQVGVEYCIEGRTTLGLVASKPFSDTISFDSKLKAYSLNPYAIFEFIEPGNLGNFSFAFKLGFNYEGVTKPDSDFNDFARSAISGGPIFGFRFLAGDHLTFIPTLDYFLSYVDIHKDQTPLAYKDRNVFQHDVDAGFNFLYRWDELDGVNAEPRLGFKFGMARKFPDDLLNVGLRLGYVRSF